MVSIKKILAGFFIFALLWPQTSFAISVMNYPSPVESMDQIMADLGVDKDEFKKTINTTVDVARLKKNPPAVTLAYVPASPVHNQEFTAMAVPAYFTNDTSNMYFTWFLKHNTGEERKKNQFGLLTKDGNTDWNDDGEFDIEDYKIEAMRILAKGEWEPDYLTQGITEDVTVDENENGYLEDEYYDEYYRIVDDTDHDGYEAFFGGDDQKGKPVHCYIHDFESGIDYEIGAPAASEESITGGKCEHFFPESDTGEMVGGTDDVFGIDDEKFWGTNPESEDTNNDGVIDEEALVGKGMNSLKWTYKKGDEVGVIIEGVSENTDYKDSSYKTMWAYTRADDANGACGIEEDEATPTVPPRGIYTFDTHGSFYCGGATGTCTLTIENCTIPSGMPDQEVFTNPGGTPGQQSYPDCGQKSCSNGRFHGGSLADGTWDFFFWKGGRENPNYELRVLLDEDYPDDCDVCISPGINIEDPRDCEEMEKRMGDNSQTSSFVDTDINGCLEENLVDPAQGTADKKIEVALSYSPQYPINDPRGQNVDSENNSDELKIIANLSNIEDKSFVKYDWKFWLCDEGGEDCVSDIVPTANNPDPSLSPQALRDNLALSRTSGLGLDTVQATLMIDPVSTAHPTYSRFDGKTELKVVLDVIETTEQAQGKSGRAIMLIPFQETQDDIIPMKVGVLLNDPNAAPDIRLSLNQPIRRYSQPGETLLSRCPDKTCPVVKNEIIGLRFNGETEDKMLSWYLNNKPLPASEEDPEMVYFPILEGAGFKYSVRLDVGETDGNEMSTSKLTLNRDFLVEEPSIQLKPRNCESGTNQNCKPVLLGTIILDETDTADPNSKKEDFSEDLFEAEETSEIVIEPIFNFENSILRNIDGNNDPDDDTWKIQWFVDGEAVVPSSATSFPHVDPLNGNLILPINKISGESYQVKAEALYNQPDPERNALFKIWNVPVNSFYEKNVSDSLEIEVIEDDGIALQSGSAKILASLFSAMPSYVNFLFRTILTLALVLFLANLSLIVFPKQRI